MNPWTLNKRCRIWLIWSLTIFMVNLMWDMWGRYSSQKLRYVKPREMAPCRDLANMLLRPQGYLIRWGYLWRLPGGREPHWSKLWACLATPGADHQQLLKLLLLASVQSAFCSLHLNFCGQQELQLIGHHKHRHWGPRLISAYLCNNKPKACCRPEDLSTVRPSAWWSCRFPVSSPVILVVWDWDRSGWFMVDFCLQLQNVLIMLELSKWNLFWVVSLEPLMFFRITMV